MRVHSTNLSHPRRGLKAEGIAPYSWDSTRPPGVSGGEFMLAVIIAIRATWRIEVDQLHSAAPRPLVGLVHEADQGPEGRRSEVVS